MDRISSIIRKAIVKTHPVLATEEDNWLFDGSEDILTEAELAQKKGHLDFDGVVFVYFNINLSRKLNTPLWSVRNAKTGVILGHDREIVLKDAEFVVGQGGKERVRKEMNKNVHAGVRGKIVHNVKADTNGTAVTYNPYKYDTFVRLPSETPVKSAKHVSMVDKKVWATGIEDMKPEELNDLRQRSEKYKG
ncbi:MAG: hypothetical protein BV459_03980 [Thermoplasmata archaeon M11B2D]|nr:MAG: hypothetical protein BV459_03980 [Thermoplasmata archaeon M11B2D]